MIKGKVKEFKTKDGGRLQRILMVVKNETVHPVTVATVYVDEVKAGYKRVSETVRVRHDQTSCLITVYDRKK